jgi:hypothetical protein
MSVAARCNRVAWRPERCAQYVPNWATCAAFALVTASRGKVCKTVVFICSDSKTHPKGFAHNLGVRSTAYLGVAVQQWSTATATGRGVPRRTPADARFKDRTVSR